MTYMSQQPHRAKNPSLTGIRGLSALWVFSYHLTKVIASTFGLNWISGLPVVDLGWTGVDLFFVLSGYVLMRAHGADFTSVTRDALIRFAKVRIARVYPLSLVVLGLVATVALDHRFASYYQTEQPGNFSVVAFLKTALLATRWYLPGTQGDWNQPIWSLSAEILGYAAFPLLAWSLKNSSCLAATTIALGSVVTLAIYHLLKHNIEIPDIGQGAALARMSCCFVAGVAWARAGVLMPLRVVRHGAALSVLATALVFLACMVPHGAILLPLAFSVLILALGFERGAIHRFLCGRVAQFFGEISFPLYLLHVMPLLWLGYEMDAWHLSSITRASLLSLYVAGCMGCAALLHVTVERPSHRFGRRWALSAKDPRAAANMPDQSTARSPNAGRIHH